MRKLRMALFICMISLTACTSNNELKVEPSPSQVPPSEAISPEPEDKEWAVLEPALIDEVDFADEQLQWIKMINQDITAINEQDVKTASGLRGISPDPSIMITSQIKSVEFIEIEKSTDVNGAIRVDYRFNDNPSEPQYALYSFEKKGQVWIIVDVAVDASYKPRPIEKVSPRLIDESNYAGEQLEWVKIINQDVKAIAEEDQETFDKLRNSEQSIQALMPRVPYVSVELIEVVTVREEMVKVAVDRRVWGNEDVETIVNYALSNENGNWVILDVD